MSNNLSIADYLALDDEALLKQCECDCFRASGPGGQKRNKTDSAVRLRHLPTGQATTAVEDRSQHVNKKRALRRLRAVIALTLRTELEIEEYERSDTLEEILMTDGRLRVGFRDLRYWVVIGEILDVFWNCQARVSEAADILGLSSAQLIKLFRRESKLWAQVNRLRVEKGYKSLQA